MFLGFLARIASMGPEGKQEKDARSGHVCRTRPDRHLMLVLVLVLRETAVRLDTSRSAAGGRSRSFISTPSRSSLQ